MKPLFIPLKTKHYEAFADGTKRVEYRRYGPRWNEKTCRTGRPVILSKGYGAKDRRTGQITGFQIRNGDGFMFSDSERADIKACFGTLEIALACIHISLDKDQPQ